MLARLALAALVGGIIGIERRHPDRPAGVRTLALTAMGAAAFTLVSIHGFGDESPTRDPARVAAQVPPASASSGPAPSSGTAAPCAG